MSEETPKMTWRDRLRWWLYGRCFAYCVRCVFPTADPAEFTILDNVNFIAITKDEVREIVFDAPDLAWRFEGLMNLYEGQTRVSS